MAAVSSTAISIAYGSSYQQAVMPFSILGVSAIISVYSTLYAVCLQALGYTRSVFSAGAFSTVVYVVCLAVLSSPFGPVGMAISRVSLASTSLLVLQYAVRSRLVLEFDRSLILKVAFISVIIFICLALIEFLVDLPIIVKAFFEFLVFSVILVSLVKLVKPLSATDRELIIGALPSRLGFLKKFL